MGLFSKSASISKSQKLHECKLCKNSFGSDFFVEDLGICTACGVVAKTFMEIHFLDCLKTFEQNANEATDPDIKIYYLGAMLGILYEYKIKYQDNDVRFITGDIEEQINQVIDCISHAREP